MNTRPAAVSPPHRLSTAPHARLVALVPWLVALVSCAPPPSMRAGASSPPSSPPQPTPATAPSGIAALIAPAAVRLGREPAVVPIDLAIGRPVLHATIGGRGPYRFIFDTGAGASLIDSSVAADLGLAVSGAAQVGSPGGAPVATVQVLAPSIAVGDATLQDVHLIRSDLKGRFNGMFDGVLSYRTMGGLLMTLDYGGNVLRLARGRLVPGEPHVIPFHVRAGPLEIPVTVFGRAMDLSLDSGGGAELSLPRALMDSVPLKGPAVSAGQLRTVTGLRSAWSAQMSGTIDVAGVPLVDPSVTFVEGERGSLGGAAIRKLIVTIDYPNQLVRLAPLQRRRAVATPPIDPLALGQRYTAWFYEGKSDSVFAKLTTTMRGKKLSSAAKVSEQASVLMSTVGKEEKVLSETTAPRTGGGFVYRRTVMFARVPAPMMVVWSLTADGMIDGLGIGPAEAMKTVEPAR